MATQYTYRGPVSNTVEADRSQVKGKTVLVTGGANGIGAEYTKAFASAGAYVVIGDLDEVAGQKLAASYPGHVWFTRTDVTSWDHQAKLFEDAINNTPNHRLDVVIANAGISGQDPVFVEDEGDKPEKPDLKILDINVIGVMYTTKLALFYFRKQYKSAVDAGREAPDSNLILQGSLAGYVDQPGSPQYNTSKFGLRGAMRCLRRTSLQHGTRVNYIAPWYIKTNIISETVAERITSKGAVFAAIEDAAEAVLKIASDKSVSGRVLAIVPRMWAPLGYVDIDHDDYHEGDPLREWQEIILRTSHRLKGPSVIE